MLSRLSQLSQLARGLPLASTTSTTALMQRGFSVTAAKQQPFADLRRVAVQGASGGQGHAYTWGLLQDGAQEVHAIVRKPQDFAAKAKVTDGTRTANLNPNEFANLRIVDKLGVQTQFIVNAASSGGVPDTLDSGPPGNYLLTQNGVDLLKGNRKDKHIEYGISVITTAPHDGGGVRVTAGGKLQVGSDNKFLGDLLGALEKQDVFKVEVVDDIRAAKMEKVALNCALNATATAFGMTLGQLDQARAQDPRYGKLIGGIATEVLEVAKAQQINVKPANQVIGTIHGVMQKFPQHPTSMQTAFRANEAIELPVLNAGVARLGDDLQVPTPLNDLMSATLGKFIELRKKGVDFYTENAGTVAQAREQLLEAAAKLY